MVLILQAVPQVVSPPSPSDKVSQRPRIGSGEHFNKASLQAETPTRELAPKQFSTVVGGPEVVFDEVRKKLRQYLKILKSLFSDAKGFFCRLQAIPASTTRITIFLGFVFPCGR